MDIFTYIYVICIYVYIMAFLGMVPGLSCSGPSLRSRTSSLPSGCSRVGRHGTAHGEAFAGLSASLQCRAAALLGLCSCTKLLLLRLLLLTSPPLNFSASDFLQGSFSSPGRASCAKTCGSFSSFRFMGWRLVLQGLGFPVEC